MAAAKHGLTGSVGDHTTVASTLAPGLAPTPLSRRVAGVIRNTTALLLAAALVFVVVGSQRTAAQEPDPVSQIQLEASGAPALTSDLVGSWTDTNATLSAQILRQTSPDGPITTLLVGFTNLAGSDGFELTVTLPADVPIIGYHDSGIETDLNVDVSRISGSLSRACIRDRAQVSILAVESSGSDITELALDFQHACDSDLGAMTLGAIRIGSDAPIDAGRIASGIVIGPDKNPIEGVVVCIFSEGDSPDFFAPGCVRTLADGSYSIEAPPTEVGATDRWFVSIFDQRGAIYRRSCIPAAARCGESLLDLAGPVRASSGILTELEIGCLQAEPTIVVDLRENPGPINGTPGNDVIVAIGGDAVINGDAGDDIICPGSGNNSVLAGPGNDVVFGGTGVDIIRGQDGNDVLVGNDGDDDLNGGRGSDQILGQAGNDAINGGAANDTLNGGSGDDVIRGSVGDDRIFGLGGNDTINGNGGFDTVFGGAGDDDIRGGPRKDILNGDGGNDTIRGLGGADTINGNSGDDDLRGGKQSDFLVGGDGVDTCRGGTTDREPVQNPANEADRDLECETHIEVELIDQPPD